MKRCKEEQRSYLSDLFNRFASLVQENINSLPRTRFRDKLKTSNKQNYKLINLDTISLLEEKYIHLKFKHHKVPIELKNFFNRSRVLLVGKDGCGKTTVCQYSIRKLWQNQLNNYFLIDIIERECFKKYKLHDLDRQKLTNLLENPSNIL